MLDPARYFDHAATTPLAPEVLREMEPFLGMAGNAGSLHAFGRRAAAAVELARERVASILGAEDPQQIVFTSGATEACNLVLANFDAGWISPFEHAAVREPALARGYRTLPNDGIALRSADAPSAGGPRTPGPELTAVMRVNNEIGAVWDVRDLPAERRFVDATQALGKIALDLDGIDYAACSAHKLYGPQGVGAAYTADGLLAPLQQGGDQEFGRRAGTLDVAGIVGFGAACALAEDRLREDAAHAGRLRGIFLENLDVPERLVLGGGDAVPHILAVAFAGLEGETLVLEADAAGFAVSAGAACSSRSTEPSHVLLALGLPEAFRRGTVRISFGRANTPESTVELARTVTRTAQKIRTIS